MAITKKNHTNPCFWTALWNPIYYNNFISGNNTAKAREQIVFSLEIKVPKILQRKVKDVHYVDGLGLGVYTDEQIEEMLVKQSISSNSKNNPQKNKENNVKVLDIENHFTVLESIGGYSHLLATVKSSQIATREDRIYLACFIIIHQLRSSPFFETLLKKYKDEVNPKLSAIIHFKKAISDTAELYSLVKPIVESKWTLFALDAFTFPLSDSPIIYYESIIWLVLSPKHLLEINISKNNTGRIKYEKAIKSEKLTLLKSQIIKTTFQSIIFSNEETLRKLKKSKSWQLRKAHLNK